VKALNKIRARNPDAKLDPQLIDARLLAEIRQHYELLLLFYSPSMAGEGAGRQLLRRALKERLDHHLEMVFRLLGLRFPIQEIHDAYAGLRSADASIRAKAAEFVESLLSAPLKQYLIPIIDEWPLDAVLETGKRFFSIDWSSRGQALSYLIQRSDLWLKACAVHTAGEWKVVPLMRELQVAAESTDPLVKETARLALERIGVNASASS
jgi:AAA family ATP:ADP antiporter